jgi:hypothetical protein
MSRLGIPPPEAEVVLLSDRWKQKDRPPMSKRAQWAHDLPDGEVPWAAIGILDIKDPAHSRVRAWRCRGRRPPYQSDLFWSLWADVIDMAKERVLLKPISEWREMAWRDTDPQTGEVGAVGQIVRDAALWSPRAFVELINLTDDEGNPIILKDFHVKTILAIRRNYNACVLLPLEHGKSYHGSITVPLMDWCEWPNATEGRIYWNKTHVVKWIRRLMDIIEFSDELHMLFPWVRRPRKGDKGYGLWSGVGFSIGGRTLPDRSFEPLTANQFPKGSRYARVGVDDIVDVNNAKQRSTQDRLFDWITSGAMSMRQALTRKSLYKTKWSTFYLVGTLYEHGDVNDRVFQMFQQERYQSLRVDVYVGGKPENGVIWPEYRSAAYVAEMERSMTTRIFNMRVRNMLGGREQQVFPAVVVHEAEYDGINLPPYNFGEVPPRARGFIGFDPGSGKITKDSKNPAYMVYAQADHAPPRRPGLLGDPYAPEPENDWYHHLIDWDRLEGYSFTRQCDMLAQLYDTYGWPVAFETNALQTSYSDYMTRHYPHVRMIGAQTTQIDPQDGVEQFEPLFRNHRVVIHAAGASKERMNMLREELTTWKGRYTDVVMAMWIARSQFQKRQHLQGPPQFRLQRPSYLGEFGASRVMLRG